MLYEENTLLNGVTSWRSCSGVTCSCVPKINLSPLRRDDLSGVLIGADGGRRSDWSVRVQTSEISTTIDRQPACRDKRAPSLSCYKVIFFTQPREWTAKQVIEQEDYSVGHCDETFLKPANQLKMADRRKLKETRLALDGNHHCSVFVIFLKSETTAP